MASYSGRGPRRLPAVGQAGRRTRTKESGPPPLQPVRTRRARSPRRPSTAPVHGSWVGAGGRHADKAGTDQLALGGVARGVRGEKHLVIGIEGQPVPDQVGRLRGKGGRSASDEFHIPIAGDGPEPGPSAPRASRPDRAGGATGTARAAGRGRTSPLTTDQWWARRRYSRLRSYEHGERIR